MDWITLFFNFWEKHKGKIIGICIGLIFGITVVAYGFWRAVFVFLCVLIGFVVGRAIDKRIGFKDTLEKIFRD